MPNCLSVEPETITIPAGPFLMGSDRNKDPEAYENEPDQFTLELPEYANG